jgi:hypothetical protein
MGAADVHITILRALKQLVGAAGVDDDHPLTDAITITKRINRHNYDDWTGARWPCAMLYFDDGVSDADAETLSAGLTEQRDRLRWIVYVGVADPRDEEDTMIGSTGVPGALALRDAVLAAVNTIDVPSPAATLRFECNGTPGEIDAIAAAARIQIEANDSTFEFKPSATEVDWGGGTALLEATCVAPAGALGNFPVGLAAAWNDSGPTHAFFSQVKVANVVELGKRGTLRERGVYHTRTQPLNDVNEQGAFYILAMTFEAEVPTEQWTRPDESRVLTPINANLNVVDTDETQSVPIDTIRVDPSV